MAREAIGRFNSGCIKFPKEKTDGFQDEPAAAGKANLMVALIAVLALWATVAFAGVNEDLSQAAMRGDPHEVNLLITKGADVNAKTRGNTALMWVSIKPRSNWGGRDLEVVQGLLAKGAEVNVKSDEGNTALMFASMAGNRQVAQALLDKGAEVNAQDKNGYTALMFASMPGWPDQWEVVQALLAKGADVNIKNNKGDTALMIATKSGRRQIMDLLTKAGAK